jgi:hypothetical protein
MNHNAPSGPAIMLVGELLPVGIGNSVMIPAVVIRPILFTSSSVNQSAPSGPAVMPWGLLLAVGIGNSEKVCAGASRGEKRAARRKQGLGPQIDRLRVSWQPPIWFFRDWTSWITARFDPARRRSQLGEALCAPRSFQFGRVFRCESLIMLNPRHQRSHL